jgi:serine phosphatase RsbU (regulator of sigma subunit)
MIRKSFLALLFSFISAASMAQGSEFMDSLRTELQKLPGKEAQCDRLSEVAFIIINEHPEYAKECAEELEKIATESGYKRGLAYAFYHYGNVAYYTDNLDEGITQLTKARELFREVGDEKGMGYCSNTLGETLISAGGYNGALKELFDALEHFQKAGSPEGIAWVNNNIGRVHYYQGTYSEALKYFNQALKTADDIRSGDAWLFITMVYIEQEQFAEAEKSVAEALRFVEKTNDQYVLADCYYCLGRIEAFYGKNDQAKTHFKFGRELKMDLEDIQGWALISTHLADLYLKMDDLDSAMILYREAASLAFEVGVKVELRDAYLGLSNVFNRIGVYDSAYYYLRLHNQLDDELKGEEASKRLAELEASLEAREREKEFENERRIQEEREAAAKREKQFMLAGGVVVILMLLTFSGFMVNRFRMKQKANKQLEEFNHAITKQKEIIEHKNKDIMDSIKYAKRIQEAILPSDKLIRSSLDKHFVLYKPKDIVSGDFYWASYVELEDERRAFLIAAVDCTGHGVPGAMVSVVGYNGLNRSVQEYHLTQPAVILDKLNDIVEETFSKHESEVRDGMDISLCLFDLEKQILQWAGANNSIWIVRNGELTETKANKQPIGKYEGRKPFTNQEFELQDGDTIYIFTDGFQDQFGGKDEKKYKASRLKEFILAMQDRDMDAQCEALSTEFEAWRRFTDESGQEVEIEQLDDVCIIGVRI